MQKEVGHLHAAVESLDCRLHDRLGTREKRRRGFFSIAEGRQLKSASTMLPTNTQETTRSV